MKIAIVGAGPAGATAALQLARARRHEVVLLDRDTFPRTKTCGSGLGPRCVELCRSLDLAASLEPLAYRIRGARFAGPSGRATAIGGDKEGAWIVPRARFDAILAGAAEQAGARFEQGVKITKTLRDPGGRVCGVSDGAREIEADLVLFADGAHSRFSEDARPKRQIATIMGWWRGVPFQPNHLEIWFAPRVLPWYGWLFPESADRVNIGICYSPDDPGDPRQILEEVIDRHVGPRMKGAEQVACECSKVVKLRGAPIVYTERIGRIAAPGALWIGEAARLTNAATGEGIFQAMKSGVLAAEAIARGPGDPGPAYTQAIRRYFTPRLVGALGLMRFTRTPMFGWLSDVVTLPPVGKALGWALSHM